MAKPILSLKKKTPETQTKPHINPEEIPANPLAVIEVVNWDIPYGDYTPEEEHFQPRQRKRRKDKQVEQYRKESKWQ